MTADLHAVEELQAELRARAETVPTPVGFAQLAAQNARRIRTRRRIAASSAVVVALVFLSPLVVRALVKDDPGPVEPAPVVTTLRWSETVPGLDLPVGDALSVAYAVGGTVTAGSLEVELEGADVTQILASSIGAIVVATSAGAHSSIWLVDGSQNIRVAERLRLSGPVVQGRGYDGQTHLAYAVDGPDAREIFAGPVLEPEPLGSDGRYLAAGFLAGEPVFSSLAEPPELTQFHTSGSRPPRGGIDHEVVGRGVSGMGAGTTIPGWWEVDDGAIVFFHEVIGCIDARMVPGFSWDLWALCDYEPADFGVFVVGPTYGAMRATVYELASLGHEVRTFDLPRASSAGTAYDLEPIGWETPTDVIIRVAAYDSGIDIRDRAPANGTYVAVRCSVDTGACERLPHPVDIVANAVNKID